jgi:hypothetical protein
LQLLLESWPPTSYSTFASIPIYAVQYYQSNRVGGLSSQNFCSNPFTRGQSLQLFQERELASHFIYFVVASNVGVQSSQCSLLIFGRSFVASDTITKSCFVSIPIPSSLREGDVCSVSTSFIHCATSGSVGGGEDVEAESIHPIESRVHFMSCDLQRS